MKRLPVFFLSHVIYFSIGSEQIPQAISFYHRFVTMKFIPQKFILLL